MHCRFLKNDKRTEMNVVRRIIHRSFGALMYAMIPLFPYREPKLVDGIGGVADLLAEKGITRVMLVTGPRVRGSGLTKPLEEKLSGAGVACTVYDGTLQNPTSDNVEEALKLYIGGGCEALIAFGGGSVMDCAKAIGARVVRPRAELSKMAGLIKVRRRLPLLIAIPTTAGTGSETTVASVIVDSATHRKYVINDFCLIPHYALLDPAVTVGLPPHLTATTGMDALTHAVEAYIGRARTKSTRAAAEEAVRLIFGNIERAYKNGEDISARAAMLRASYLAGLAFTKSYVGYVHAVAHTLGGKYGIAHGYANAVLLPKVLRAYGKHAQKPLAELARAVGISDSAADDKCAAEAIISHIEGMNERMGIPRSLDCIVREDIPAMAKIADKEANPLYPVPELRDAKELEEIYLLALEEEA